MADDETDAETEDEDGAKPKSKKKKLIIIGAGVLVLLLAGGGAFMMMGGEEVIEPPAGAGVVAADDPDKPKAKPVFHELPSLLVNLTSEGKQSAYLRVVATLELEPGVDLDLAKAQGASVLDGFQAFLREMRPRDLSGSAGLMRLKEELLVRANASFDKPVVRNVLLTEFLIQ